MKFSCGFWSEKEFDAFIGLVRSANPKTMIEIGVNAGSTAKAVLEKLPEIESYIGIDVVPGYVTSKAVQRAEVPNADEVGSLVAGDPRFKLIIKDRGSLDLTPADLPSCDVVFIDGDHGRESVEHDSALAHALLRPGGVIIWHDYYFLSPGETPVVDVKEVVDTLSAAGHPIFYVEGTCLAYEDRTLEIDPLKLRTWEAWNKIHQPFELEWWKEALATGHSNDTAFIEHWKPIVDFINPKGHVIDIGCGPRPPFIPSSVIDPLALEYQKLTPKEWWADIEVHVQPAEMLIPDLRGDTIICWNCIDHTIGWRQLLDNMVIYGKPGARFAIATDFFPPFTGHPGFSRDGFMSEIDKRFTITDRREPFGRALALLLVARG